MLMLSAPAPSFIYRGARLRSPYSASDPVFILD